MINYLTLELLEEMEDEIEEKYNSDIDGDYLLLILDNAKLFVYYTTKTIPQTECNPEETKYELESWDCNVKNNLTTSDVKELFHSYLN